MTNTNKLHAIFRPKTVSEVIGQTHILKKDSLIPRMIQKKYFCSLIFYGPPGIGKTSLAIALANDLGLVHDLFNASIDSKDTLNSYIKKAYENPNYILIIDEIHRMNRDKQDILLPLLENNQLHVFITTTENPFFVINPALRSRCQILQMNRLTDLEIYEGMMEKIIPELSIKINEKQLYKIIHHCNQDCRAVVNTLDLLDNLYENETITDTILQNIMIQNHILGSAEGDEIHDTKSAFHKSIRGSDVNASVYYLARLLQIGDFEAIYRRMLAIAYEDIGLANPNLAIRVSQAIDNARYLGMPEARLPLVNAVIEMAMSPKSNSAYLAITNALDDLKNGYWYGIPMSMRDQNYKSAIKLGVKGYQYPHNFPGNYVKQQYLPLELIDKTYYVPANNPHETKLHQAYQLFIMNALKKQR